MFHHGLKGYQEAASQAARVGRQKMEEVIARGTSRARAVIEQVESQVPQDRIAIANKLSVETFERASPYDFQLHIPGIEPIALHDHAINQITEKIAPREGDSKADKFSGYFQALRSQGQWGKELAAVNANLLLAHASSRHLIRTVTTDKGPEVRGFLSDKFRRLDNRPLLDAFIGALKSIGALPIDGFALDTKVRMRAVLPIVFEPIKDEVMIFGLEWGNSDFGNGGHQVALWSERLVCTNLLVADIILRQVHLGKRLDDNITYSRRTYEYDTKTNASALKDVVHDALSPERVNQMLESIRTANETDLKGDIGTILKNRLSKGELEKIKDLYEGQDVLNLPPGKTAYRLSNAVSWFAQAEGISEERKLALQEISGSIMPDLLGRKAQEV